MSTVFYSIILIFSANARSCANDIQRSIGDCKVTTMGKSSAYMELYRDAGNENVYTQMYVLDDSGAYQPYGEPQRVGTRRVTVKYMPEAGAALSRRFRLEEGAALRFGLTVRPADLRKIRAAISMTGFAWKAAARTIKLY